ncbi:MAG: hypothetical protein AAB074_03640 [Planctomycetota bacterium]
MKRLLALTAVIALVACERKAGRIGDIPFAVDATAALAQAKAENKPLFVEFWSDD